MRNYFAFALVM